MLRAFVRQYGGGHPCGRGDFILTGQMLGSAMLLLGCLEFSVGLATSHIAKTLSILGKAITLTCIPREPRGPFRGLGFQRHLESRVKLNPMRLSFPTTAAY